MTLGFVPVRRAVTPALANFLSRHGNLDCTHIIGRPVELILRQDQLTQIRAHPGGIKRNFAPRRLTAGLPEG